MKQFLERTTIVLILLWVTIGYYTGIVPMMTILYIGIGANIYLIIKARKFKPVSFMFVFWLSFILCTLPYYSEGKDISGGRNIFDIPRLYDQTTFNHVFFLLVTALFFPNLRAPVYMKDRFIYRKSMFGFLLTTAIMVFIILFGQSGKGVFAAGGYATGASQSSTFNEYFLILVPVALVFTGNIPLLKRTVYLIIALYIVKDLSFGGRNGTLQNGLLLFLMLDNKKIKYWHVALFGSIPVYLMMIFGTIRANPLLLFSSSTSDILMLPFKGDRSFAESLDTQADVFYASVRFLGLLDFDILHQSDRIKVFFYHFMAVIMPYSWLPPSANLAAFELYRYNAGGGGLISAYWFFFLGLPGVAFISWYINFIIRKILTSQNIFFILYACDFMSSYPRWFAYNPVLIFKLCIYGPLFYFFIKLTINIIKSQNRQDLVSKQP